MKDDFLVRRQAQEGVTVIEMVVTLVVVIVLSVIAIPAMISLVQEHRLTTTTENLYAVLQYARTEAVKRNANIYVSFQTGDTWCYGVNPTSACNCTIANNCTLGTYSYSAPGSLTLSNNGLSGNSVYFEGSHGAANASGTVTFTLYGQTKLMTVSISRMGNLQLCATGISGYTAC